ncbi:MAG: aldehyde dehydrogenase, partial [Candidatus Aenigmarchaeota archaeon]|nr:aldehyde dehydrogenase [Candidatus Aenigmarchaeota archaeon]
MLDAGMIEVRNFINGKAGFGYSGSFECSTPFSAQKLGDENKCSKYSLPNSSVADVGFALSAARLAYSFTSALSFSQRMDVLLTAAKNFVVAQEHENFIVASTGMPVKFVRQRFEIGIQLMLCLADICAERYGVQDDMFVRTVYRDAAVVGHELRLAREGPVSVFLPPNDPAEPFFIFSHAVLSGQSLVVKPSHAEPLTSVVLAQALTQAGYPDGGLNVVHWNSADKARALLGFYLCRETPLRIVMGNTASVQSLLSGQASEESGEVVSGTTIQFCAGHTACVVFDDADFERAAEHIVKSAYEWTIDCVSAKTVVVVGLQARDKLLVHLKELVSKKVVGSPFDEATDIGYVPAQTLSALDEVLRGQREFGAVHHHVQYNKLSSVQVAPVLCEAVSLNFPLFGQEAPYVLTLYVCASERELPGVLEKLRDILPGKRMGIGIYTGRCFNSVMPLLRKCHSHLVFFNTSTINLNFALAHQDVFLSDELL